MAIENIHRLRSPERDWERPFANLFTELEEPELLFLSLLFHDVGKGMACEDHVAGSMRGHRESLYAARSEARPGRYGALSDSRSPGDVRQPFAPGYFRSGNDPGLRRASGHAGTIEAAGPLHLRGHPRRQSRGADFMESGIALAAVCFDVQLSEPQPGRRAIPCRRGASRFAVRRPHFPADRQGGLARGVGVFSRGLAAAVSFRPFRRRRLPRTSRWRGG